MTRRVIARRRPGETLLARRLGRVHGPVLTGGDSISTAVRSWVDYARLRRRHRFDAELRDDELRELGRRLHVHLSGDALPLELVR